MLSPCYVKRLLKADRRRAFLDGGVEASLREHPNWAARLIKTEAACEFRCPEQAIFSIAQAFRIIQNSFAPYRLG